MALVARSPSQPTFSPSRSGELDPNMGVMRDILDELDRERSKRAELEVMVRKLLAEKAQQEKQDEFTISRKHYSALQTELQGYRDLIEAMTIEKPAIRKALEVHTRQRMVPTKYDTTPSSPSLPIHVIRLLEIMPWDPRATEYAFAKEEMYEWQFYDTKEKKWRTEIRQSPKFFRTLPTEEPKPGVNSESQGDRPFLGFLGNKDSGPCVLTNHSITKLYNLTKGYPLPENGGTWQWVGGWRVEKNIAMNYDLTASQQSSSVQDARSRREKVDLDEEGWSYAMEAAHFLLNPTETCWDNPGTTDMGNGSVPRPVRRRKWTRQRALVDYPHASESTKCFLSLMAHRMYATTAANKISEQLVGTKVALTEAESVLLQCKEEVARQERLLNEVLKAKGKWRRKGKEKGLVVTEETTHKIVAAIEAANQMQNDITKALDSSSSSRDKNYPSSPL